VLHDVEGYERTETGRLLGVSESTSKSRLPNAGKAKEMVSIWKEGQFGTAFAPL
jgi:hypothetical protein